MENTKIRIKKNYESGRLSLPLNKNCEKAAHFLARAPENLNFLKKNLDVINVLKIVRNIKALGSLFRYLSRKSIHGEFCHFVSDPELATHQVPAQKVVLGSRQKSTSGTKSESQNSLKFRHKNRKSDPVPY
jgi:hypothetical protein